MNAAVSLNGDTGMLHDGGGDMSPAAQEKSLKDELNETRGETAAALAVSNSMAEETSS